MFQSAMRIFCCSNLQRRKSSRLPSAMFQSAMRIFCCSNSLSWHSKPSPRHGSFNPPCGFFVVRTPTASASLAPVSARVSIRHADFLLFERLLDGGEPLFRRVSIRHADFLLFELSCLRGRPAPGRGFNPPCGFFVVRTAELERHAATLEEFQSAMRIFCCSNCWVGPGRSGYAVVSIRHADFLLFERRMTICISGTTSGCFNPPCGFFVVRTSIGSRPIAGRGRFNPPCGFFVVRTITTRRRAIPRRRVSIRHADFLLFEQPKSEPVGLYEKSFNPPCGFFVVRTAAGIVIIE